ncbi:MFS transporter [Nocardia amikacinitolerans]|uniref:MFS transporter n=1 Tax=Nocardia amikacinitolerans TaxID=756689 RepID=UPI0020A25AB6|nr:MFS transporter [Nocardia amikacinitolerans]MCP2279323.1 putative arabinose efflux permease, MFS family [Nocardia amikacinitolerans]
MGISVEKASAAAESDGIDNRLSVLLALACGISVANVYYAQPLLDGIGADLGIGSGQLGLVTTLTQAGYLLGLMLLVPLGDLLDRRRLITGLAAVASAGSVVIAVSGRAVVFLAACALVGLVSVVVQVVVAYAAVLSAPARRGAVVGTVTSGVVIGILLARTVSGLVAEVAGWRAVFAVSAVLMLTLTFALARALPSDTAARQRISYGDLITSVVRLTIREPVFRARSLIALFMFAAFGAVWGSMALPLAAAPWRLSEAEIGLFGIVGAAGAVGAARAGRWADRGLGQWISAGSLAVLALSWLFIWGAPHSLLLLAVGVAALDFAGQALHVINQNLIVAIDPAASSRLIGSYMVFYSLGTGGGAIAATALYSATGWGAVCLLGVVLSGMAALVWIVDRWRREQTTDPLTSRAAACQGGRGRCSGPRV